MSMLQPLKLGKRVAAWAKQGGPVLRPGEPWRGRAVAVIAWCCWLYAATVFGLWVLLGTAADRAWPATLVMYGPRWLWALPLLILLPVAAVVRPRSLWLLLVGLA